MSERKSFETLYCARHGCDAAAFRRRLFWRALHRRCLPVAPLLLFGGYFECDRELIAAMERVRSPDELREEIETYRHHPQNRGWLRRTLRLRISTTRLRRIALGYLSNGTERALAA